MGWVRLKMRSRQKKAMMMLVGLVHARLEEEFNSGSQTKVKVAVAKWRDL